MLQELEQAGLGPDAAEQLWMHLEAVRRAEAGEKVAFSTGTV